MKRTLTGFAAVPLILAMTTVLVACAPDQPVQTPAEQPAAQQVAPQSATQAPAAALDAIEQMSPSQKRSQLATAFPVEVPVPQGEVVLVRAQGPDVWDYELRVNADPVTVRDWYGRAYQQRSWQVESAGELTQDSPGYYLTVRKNAAESRVDVLGADGAPTTTVKVVVGVGAPILDTF